MEIATRAMKFWSYQTSQERYVSVPLKDPTTFSLEEVASTSAFQAMVFKNAQERLLAVERQTNSGKLIHSEER